MRENWFRPHGLYFRTEILFVLNHSGFLGDVQSIQKLSDILVLHCGGLLDQGSGLRDCLDGVSMNNQLVLLGLGVLDHDAIVHPHTTDEFLSQEVSHFDQSAALGDGAGDGEMSIDGSHLVFVSLRWKMSDTFKPPSPEFLPL